MRPTPWGDVDSLRTRRLPPGRGSSRAAVEASQRERLFTALVALSDERGYHSVRVDDLTALAGISRGAFYSQFAGKDECLVAAIVALTEMGADALQRTVGAETSPARRLRSALAAFAAGVAAQPAAARLALIDAYGAGDAALDRADLGLSPLRELVAEALGDAPPQVARGLVGGLRWVAVARLRERREEELPGLVPDLADWMLRHATPPVELGTPPSRRPRDPAGTYVARDQTERIMLAMLAAVAEKGYAATTIADVAAQASTSTRTFYAEFDDKQDAYLSALDFARVHAYAAALAASRRAPDWPSSIRAGVQGLCGFLATEQPIANASVVGPYGAGEAALERHDRAVRSFTRSLQLEQATEAPVTPVMVEAIGGAVDALLFDAVRADGGARVRAVEPFAAYLALTPFVGSRTAAELAAAPAQTRRRVKR